MREEKIVKDWIMNKPTTRREMLLIAAAGGVATVVNMNKVSAQQGIEPDDLPSFDKMKNFHTDQLQQIIGAHYGITALSQDGLMNSLERMNENHVLIDSDENDILLELINKLFASDNLDSLSEEMNAFIDDGLETLGETARSIAAVISSSLDLASNYLKGIDYSIVKLAIAHDIKGALEGAAAGASLASKFPFGFTPATGAIIGALLGGTSTSAIGYLESRG